jgi:hypothetical protein
MPGAPGFTRLDEDLTERIVAGIAPADAALPGKETYWLFARLWSRQTSRDTAGDPDD